MKYKQLAGGGMLKIVNQTVRWLSTLGYKDAQIDAIVPISTSTTRSRARRKTRRALAGVRLRFPPRNGKRSIAWRAHIRMMAAAQRLFRARSQRREYAQGEHARRRGRRVYGRWRLG